VDVNIYASNPQHAALLAGNHENTEVGNFLRDYLGLDLESITKELREKGAQFDTLAADGTRQSWMGRTPPAERKLDELDHYSGDFKKRSSDCGCLH
jgi:alkaline phosphatase